MTWLIFRVEETGMLLRSLKSFVGMDAHWNMDEFIDSLPEIKLLTMALVLCFIIGHGLSKKVGGMKNFIAKQNPIIWGACCGILISMMFLLRPSETVDFIYFRF